VEKFNAGQAKMARNIKIEDEEAKDEKAEAKFEASYD
jgi:predicted transcriptional regulator